jgi:transcription termination factor NusB
MATLCAGNMKSEINKVALSIAGNHYDSFTDFEAGIQGNGADKLFIGILGLTEEIQTQLRDFVRHRFYEALGTNLLLLTEAGDVIASHIREEWIIVHEDLEAAFHKSPIEVAKIESIAKEFLKQRAEDEEESTRREAQLIVKSFARAFARLLAENASALQNVEWRQLEQILAEVLEGIGFSVELTPPSKDQGRDIILTCHVRGKLKSYIVEVKHWLSHRVGQKPIAKFLKVVMREKRDIGLILSTYGYSSNAFEALTSVERRVLRFGDEDKIISLCKVYMATVGGIEVPMELLPEVLINETI